jgi:hypothetical protein
MTSFWILTLIAGLLLQVLVISSLIRGPAKQFPFAFTYMLAVLFSSVADAAAYFSKDEHLRHSYTRYYWIGDTVHQFLIFCVVLSLIYRILGGRGRSILRVAIVPATLVAAGISFYGAQGTAFGTWMTGLARNLSFCAALLNMVLWMALIRHSPDDQRLLLISGGLGIEMAGKAIGHSLRRMSRMMITPGNLLIVLSHLLCLYIWWRAFREVGDSQPQPPEQARAAPNP